jgi:DNA-binding transcriptional MerR regulator
MGPDAKTLTLKDMVRRSGNTPRTIRFYEEVGLLRPAGRTPGGHRLFAQSELEKLQLITDLRLAGFSLDEIKTIFDLRRSGDGARQASAEATRILGEKIDDLKRRLSALVQLRDEFASSVEVLQTACATCKEPPGQELCEACTCIDRERLPRMFRWIWDLH